MTDNLFFYWQEIASDGHKLVTPIHFYSGFGLSPRPPELSIMASDISGPLTIKSTAKLNESLFLEFSRLEKSPEAVIRFADKWGLIGVAQGAVTKEHKADASLNNGVLAVSKEKEINHYLVNVEPLTDWYAQISDMALAVYLLDLYSKNNKQELNRIFKWEEHEKGLSVRNEIKLGASIYRGVVYSYALRPHLLDRAKRGNVILPLLTYVQELINKKYSDHVSAQMIFTEDYKKIVHHFVPNNLLGFMWIQFARAFEGRTPYGNCKQCGNPFMAEKNRGNPKQFCSSACKSKNYRDSKSS